MISCAVYGCVNNTLTTTDPAIQYYFFPKHTMYAQQWINACMCRADQIDINTARICSIHFDTQSYSNEYKMIDYLGCYVKMLKYDAIPTLYLPQQVIIKTNFDENVHAQPESSEIKNIIVYNVTNEDQDFTTYNDVQANEPYNETKIEEHLPLLNNSKQVMKVELTENDKSLLISIKTQTDYCNLLSENENLKNQLEELQNRYEKTKAKHESKIETRKSKDIELKKWLKKYYTAENQSINLEEQYRILSLVFSESQIKILSGKKKIYWSNDDMAMGYTIRHMSNKRCYTYLTKTLNIPLPALSSIKRWVMVKKADFDKVLKKESDDRDEEQDSD